MHPDDVMSGTGAAKLGGRFVPIGKKALYVSGSEETLLLESRLFSQEISACSQTADLIFIDQKLSFPRVQGLERQEIQFPISGQKQAVSSRR